MVNRFISLPTLLDQLLHRLLINALILISGHDDLYSYGRLGHACQDNELRPRVVDGLARLTHVKVANVAAGAGCSMAITTNGHLFYWGKLPNAPRGEATM